MSVVCSNRQQATSLGCAQILFGGRRRSAPTAATSCTWGKEWGLSGPQPPLSSTPALSLTEQKAKAQRDSDRRVLPALCQICLLDIFELHKSTLCATAFITNAGETWASLSADAYCGVNTHTIPISTTLLSPITYLLSWRDIETPSYIPNSNQKEYFALY